MRVWCGTLDGSGTNGVDVVEKADYLGGTSAVSGGMF